MTYSKTINNTFKKFFAPTAAATFGLVAMSILNAVFASTVFGEAGSFVIGVCLPVTIFVEIVTYFFGIGGGIAISLNQGQSDTKRASEIFSTAVVFTVAISIIVALLGTFFSEHLAAIFGAKNALEFLSAVKYLKILFAGMPVILLTTVLNALIRNDNNPRYAMAGVLAALVTNIALVILYIPILHLQIEYIAIATVVSQSVSALIYIAYFFDKKSVFKFNIKLDFSTLREINRPGFAGSMIFLAQMFLTVIINNVLVSVSGFTGIAVYGVVKYVITFIYAVYDSINHSVQPMFGVYKGERDNDSVKLAAKTAFTANIVASVVIFVLLMITAPFLTELFSVGVTSAIRIVAISCLFSSSVTFLTAYYRATENARLSLIFIILNNIVFPSVLIFLNVYVFGLEENGVWLALVISEFLTLAVITVWTRGKFLLLEKTEIPAEKQYKTLIVNEEANIVSITSEIENFCEKNGIGPKKQYYILLCIEEIAVNIIKHGFKDGKEHYIDIRIINADDGIILNIRDDAVQYDPTQKTDADTTLSVEEREIGGLGIHLVKKVSSEFSYKRVIGFNNLHIKLEK